MRPEPAHIGAEDSAAQLISDPGTPLGHAYAQALSGTAAARVRQLRQRAPLAEPDRTPGAPHPDPFLASRGCTSTNTASTPAAPNQNTNRQPNLNRRPDYDSPNAATGVPDIPQAGLGGHGKWA